MDILFRSNSSWHVSITLAVFPLAAFLTTIFEPIFYGRKVLWYEVFFGLIIIAGLVIILQVEINYFSGILYALTSIIIGVLFTLIIGKLIEKHEPSVITYYEFIAGLFFITIYFLVTNKFNSEFYLQTIRFIYSFYLRFVMPMRLPLR